METDPTLIDALEICNMALAKLGEQPIQYFDPNGNAASRLCYLHYHPIRRMVLCAKHWEFAQGTVKSEAKIRDKKKMYRHELPFNALHVLKVSPNPGWVLHGNKIISPFKRIEITYIRDTECIKRTELQFINAFVTFLAARLCKPLTGSTIRRDMLLEVYHRILTSHRI